MRDLSRASGLDLRLDSRRHILLFGRASVYGQGDKNSSLRYRLYTDARGIKDTDILFGSKLRVDLTLLEPAKAQAQMPRTSGNYLKGAFPKLYEALYGEAWFLLQKENKDDCRIIEEAILAKAKPGQKIIIPPGYGYILINPGKDDLVAASFSSTDLICESQGYAKAKGGAYFIFKDNLGEFFQPNPYYQEVPYMRMASPGARMKSLGLDETSPVYNLLSKGMEKLDFLNNPAKYDYSDAFKFL